MCINYVGGFFDMKKTYTKPEVEVSAVSAQDILNASNEAFINAEVLFQAFGF